MKKIKIISVSIILSILILVWVVYAADYYRVNHWTEVKIDMHWVCKIVDNNSSYDYFVPTKYSWDWSAFRGHLPSSVYLDTCPYERTFSRLVDDWTIRIPGDKVNDICWQLTKRQLNVYAGWNVYSVYYDSYAAADAITYVEVDGVTYSKWWYHWITSGCTDQDRYSRRVIY